MCVRLVYYLGYDLDISLVMSPETNKENWARGAVFADAQILAREVLNIYVLYINNYLVTAYVAYGITGEHDDANGSCCVFCLST